MSASGFPPADVEWDDELWELVWERTLNPVERQRIGMAVVRQRRPAEPLDATVGAELSRRWRRRARNLAVLYGLWTLFWGSLAWSDVRVDGAFQAALTPVCAGIGLLAVAACLVFRARMLCIPERFVTAA